MSDAALAGARAFVTGGNRGIGFAIAKRLIADGAEVTIAARDAEALGLAAAKLDCRKAVLDVTDPEAARAVVDAAGTVDLLVNNAGAALSKPFLKIELEELGELLAVNLAGAFLLSQLVLPQMIDRGFGRIVNIASTAGLKGYPYTSAYCATKHGLIGLTRALAIETAKTGVTVNAVCPGFTETDMAARAIEMIEKRTGRSEDDARAALAQINPQNRLTDPEEVAAAVAFLCRRENHGLTGQAIVVAGGEVM